MKKDTQIYLKDIRRHVAKYCTYIIGYHLTYLLIASTPETSIDVLLLAFIDARMR